MLLSVRCSSGSKLGTMHSRVSGLDRRVSWKSKSYRSTDEAVSHQFRLSLMPLIFCSVRYISLFFHSYNHDQNQNRTIRDIDVEADSSVAQGFVLGQTQHDSMTNKQIALPETLDRWSTMSKRHAQSFTLAVHAEQGHKKALACTICWVSW
jgi:hypothetical protein